MAKFSVSLDSKTLDRVYDIRDVLEDRLDREFTIDEIVNIILMNVNLFNL